MVAISSLKRLKLGKTGGGGAVVLGYAVFAAGVVTLSLMAVTFLNTYLVTLKS